MTLADTRRPWRLRLSAGWRALLSRPAAPDFVFTPFREEDQVEGRIYVSDQPEPGQATTALGRYATSEHLIVAPEIPGERTQVIRVPQRNELGQAVDEQPVA